MPLNASTPSSMTPATGPDRVATVGAAQPTTVIVAQDSATTMAVIRTVKTRIDVPLDVRRSLQQTHALARWRVEQLGSPHRVCYKAAHQTSEANDADER